MVIFMISNKINRFIVSLGIEPIVRSLMFNLHRFHSTVVYTVDLETTHMLLYQNESSSEGGISHNLYFRVLCHF